MSDDALNDIMRMCGLPPLGKKPEANSKAEAAGAFLKLAEEAKRIADLAAEKKPQ